MRILLGSVAASPLRLWVGLVLGLLLPLVGCKRNVTTPPVATTPFLPAAENQSHLLSSITLRGIEGTLSTAATLSKNLGLPFGKEELRGMVMARTGLPDSLLQHLDLAQPVGVAVIARTKGTSPFRAAALMAKSPRAAQSFIAQWGTKLGEQRGALRLRGQDGSEIWIYRDGALLVGSESFDGLRAAGAHAIRSRQKPGEDLLATFFPEAWARSEGTDLKTAVQALKQDVMAQLRAATRRSVVPSETLEPLLGGLVTVFLDPLVEAKSLDLALSLDARTGFKTTSRLIPMPASQLAQNLSRVNPYALDPALLTAPLPPGLFAVRYSQDMAARYGEVLRAHAAAGPPASKAFLQGIQTLLASLSGSHSGRLGFDRALEYTVISPLNKGVEPATVMGALESMLGPSGLGSFLKATTAAALPAPAIGTPPTPPQFSWQRQGLKGRFDLSMPARKAASPEAALLDLLGGDRLSYTMLFGGGRLLMTSSARGEAAVAPLVAPAGAAPVNADVQQVVEETKGREGFVYLDLFQLLRPALASASRREPSLAQANAVLAFIPGVDKLRVPVLASYVGGKQLTAELYVPLRTFQNLASILRPLLGMGLGGALAPGR